MRRALSLIAALSLPLAAARAEITPPSGARIVIEDAKIDDLACRGRGLAFEAATHSARHFSYMKQSMFNKDIDPQTLVMGIFGTLLLVPLTIAAVPLDLLASPLRRRCEFTLHIDGSLTEWAGGRVPGKVIFLESRNETSPGVPGVAAPEFFTAQSSATADASARFSISIAGRTGRSKSTALFWRIDGQEGSLMSLNKSGGRFVLSEEDAGFGSGVFENEAREIVPTARARP